MKLPVLDCRGDWETLQVQSFHQPRLEASHGDFSGSEILYQSFADNRLVKKAKIVAVNGIAKHHVATGVFELRHNTLKLVDAVGLVIYRRDDGGANRQFSKRFAQINFREVIE